jgi:hypothetical protein
MVAVYTVLAANGLSAGDHAIVAVYSVVAVIAAVGVAPVTGAVTPAIAAVEITCGGFAAVAGNTDVTTPEFAELLSLVAPATVKKFAGTPVKV